MTLSNSHILVTGANGFIGKNLVVHLNELKNVTVSTFERGDDAERLRQLLAKADAVVHLAGENRPVNEDAFLKVNFGLTSSLCGAIESEYAATGRHVPLLLASSTQVEHENPYGRSKLLAEEAVQALAKKTGNPCVIFRLPGVFGKWCKPNYNSVVATFCYNLARNLPIQINDSSANLRLVYIDDVVAAMLAAIEAPIPGYVFATVASEYTVTVGDLAKQILNFSECRRTLIIERVGASLVRALYATYVSYLPNEKFSYEIQEYADSRGIFVEMLKTADSGQFSYFTARPGVTRGGHYHHTKTEKFLVVQGEGLFRFRHLLTNELFEIQTSGNQPTIVDTIPGWVHEIKNTGKSELLVIVWANENFNKHAPDTIANKV
jgi:UDP-2-acetamido-2,6-beta-L-arabino-hexul-4-ose reductase